MLRMHLSVSRRYVDMQHTSPATLAEKTHHLEMAPWQTKTSHAGHKIKTKYVAIKHTRTGIAWWTPAVATATQLLSKFPNIDYMCPKLDKLKQKFILQPASHNHVQTMLRHILATEGVEASVATHITKHSLRLWAAEMAY